MGTSSEGEESADSTRKLILSFIGAHPGAYLRLIKRELNVAMGVIQYHLYTLEREKKIISRRRGLYKRFYLNLVFGEEQRDILDLLSQENERDIVLFLIKNPGSTQKELAEFALISAATVNWHMKRLRDGGIVEVRRDGQFVRYFVRGDYAEILKLLIGYHPSVWEKWADRLGSTFEEIQRNSKLG
ncbi:MAG: winged helix-turn-helix transcriptional regulator [Nitrososphaerales archaeon]